MNRILFLLFSFFGICHTSYGNSVDTFRIATAFYGIDDYLPVSVYCPGAGAVDGLVIVFTHKIDPLSLDATDFLVTSADSTGHLPICAMLTPAGESNERRTVLLVGQFGSSPANEPVRVEIIGDLYSLPSSPTELASCSPAQNYLGVFIDSVITLTSGPAISFCSVLDSAESQLGLPGSTGAPGNSIGAGCPLGTQQVIQVVWSGGITPYINGMTESALKDFYTVWFDSIGVLVGRSPVGIADLNDNDNYHDLCLNTIYDVKKISFEAGYIQDPNGDPNAYTERVLTYCDTASVISTIEGIVANNAYRVYPNPVLDVLTIENYPGLISYEILDALGRRIVSNKADFGLSTKIDLSDSGVGVYFLRLNGATNAVVRLIVCR